MSIEQNDYICSMHGRAEPKGDLRFEPTVQLSLLCSHSFFLCIGSPFWSHHPLSFSFFSGETAVFAERSMSKLLLCGGTTSDCNLCGWMAPLPAMCRCHQLTQTTYTYFFGIMSSRMRGDIPPQNEGFFRTGCCVNCRCLVWLRRACRGLLCCVHAQCQTEKDARHGTTTAENNNNTDTF